MSHQPASTHDLLLYDFPGSPCSRRVKITMAEKGLTWRVQLVDLSRMEQRSPRFLAVNPNGLVPALAHGNRVIWESNVITEYLDRVFPDVALYPLNASDRLAVKKWQAGELAMAKVFRPLMYQRMMGPMIRATRTHAEAMEIARRSTTGAADLAWEDRVWRLAVLNSAEQDEAVDKLLVFADQVESALSAGDWLVGDAFSQAEISVYPRLAMYPWVGIELSGHRHRRTTTWMKRLADRSSFATTQDPEERKLVGFITSPAFRFVTRVTTTPEADRKPWDRLGLRTLGWFMRRQQRRAAPVVGAWLQPASTPPATGAPGPRGAADLASAQLLRLDAPAGSGNAGIVQAALAWRGLASLRAASGPFGLRFGVDRYLELAAALDVVDLLQAPGPRLFPDDPWLEAQVREWLAFDTSMHKEIRALEAAKAGEPPPLGMPSVEWAGETLAGRLKQIDDHLSARIWLAGDELTFADVALARRLESLAGLGVPASAEFPRLAHWLERATTALGEVDNIIPASG